jgi:hypothetical protein
MEILPRIKSYFGCCLAWPLRAVGAQFFSMNTVVPSAEQTNHRHPFLVAPELPSWLWISNKSRRAKDNDLKRELKI